MLLLNFIKFECRFTTHTMLVKKEYQVKEISAEETYLVRHPVLRTGKPIATCAFVGDNLASTIHLGLFHKNNIIGVVSFMQTKHELFNKTSQYQLRGMAILQPYQGKGLGNILLQYGEALLANKNVDLIWCNARKKALNFYKRRAYKIKGTSFNISDIGAHFRMYKVL